MNQLDAARPEIATQARYDVVVVGAGFAGMYMLYRLRAQGLSVRVYETGGGVGGTWYWNRYPGARVDNEALEYSYSFSEELEREWRWTERYAAQPELLRYANHVADRFDLRRDIQFDTRVFAMAFDEADDRWTIVTDRGDRVSARHVVMATGCLSAPKDIDIAGIGAFRGPVYRTSLWPREGVDFTGRKVAVIGTGSSGVQAIPEIAKQAAQLTVYQRTANFSVPCQNVLMSDEMVEEWMSRRDTNRRLQREQGMALDPLPVQSALEVSDEERLHAYDAAWRKGGFALGRTFTDIPIDRTANFTASAFIREKIRGIVRDPVTAEKLTPTGYPFMSKRPCVDSGYFETFNRDNVTLIDVGRTPIETVTEKGIVVEGAEREYDDIVLAIGFDALSGALRNIDINGRDGRRLSDEWARDPRAYLGVAIAGYPNMFIITGPGSPSVLSNMMVSIEQHVEWIAGCIQYVNERRIARIEASAEAQAAWSARVDRMAAATLYPLADSWYVGANVPGKARKFTIYTGSWQSYREACETVAADGYAGFHMARAG